MGLRLSVYSERKLIMNINNFKVIAIVCLLMAALLSALYQSYLITILVFIVVFIEIISIVERNQLKKQIFEVTRSLKYFRESGKTQKYLIQNQNDLSYLILEINSLMDAYEVIVVDKKVQSEQSKQLLSNLSHDIRTPLTSIIGYVDALNDGIVTDEEELKEFIKILSMKSKNLKHLTDQIFNVARIDAEDVVMNFEYIELNEFLRNIVIDFIPQFEKYEIEFNNEIKEEKYMVYADRVALTRIFQNILKNAIQHGKDGKEIGIRTRLSYDYYRVIIWDRGKGIPKAKQKHIFERLFKVDDARKFGASNSGLGMSIAKKLIDKHKGQLSLRSEENHLTEFFIELPILKELDI